ncbi:MAG: adenylate/guanylate cyclase domain-containing protein [Rhodospirillales bacterium]|nr:adenylate/guanylate cyclase domain-containing protein [Rhodospirillales bacterium]
MSVIVLIAAAFVSRAEPSFLVGVRESLFDSYQRLEPRVARDAPVRIVDIDEESLARLGQWPWPRSRLAELLQKLDDARATTVALDILLAEPDRTSPSRLLLPRWQGASSHGEGAEALPDYDQQLAATMATGRVVTGFALVEAGLTALPAMKAGLAFVGEGGGSDDAPAAAAVLASVPGAAGAVGTLPMFEHAAKGNGALSISLSAGGVIRRLPLLLQAGGHILPSLGAEALRVAQGSDTYVVKVADGGHGIDEVQIGAYRIPTDRAGQIWLYASKPVTSRFIPAWKVIVGEVPPAELEGRIVLIGSTARGLQDVHQTPLGDDVPGVEFHAQALEQVIHEVYLRRPDWAKGAEILTLLALGATVLTVGSRAGPTWTAVCAGAGVVGAFAVSWEAFIAVGLLLDPLFPAATVIAVYFVSSLLRHLQTEREQRWIRMAFASYISPKLVNALIEDPGQLQLGGERRELTFLFTDLEGFTPLVERTPPAVVVPALNAYLDGMIRIAFAHDGTVDKIIGDAVHIMFGAPVADPAHAERAIACALEIDRFAKDFARQKRSEGLAFGQTRIGVNSGIAIVGNFGGALRFDYTAHGDAINTAARLEGANKYLGTRLCVSEETARRSATFFGRPAGNLLLKGKTEPVRVFEPLDPGAVDDDALRAYEAAFALLEAGDPAAEAAFAATVGRAPEDGLAAFHLRRLRAGQTGSTVILTEK